MPRGEPPPGADGDAMRVVAIGRHATVRRMARPPADADAIGVSTPTASLRRTLATTPKADPLVRGALIEGSVENARDGDADAVVIARVADPSKLLDGGSRTLHKDVVEALVDLALALLDEEDGHAEDPDR